MKKIRNFIPLIVIFTLILTLCAAIFLANSKQNIAKNTQQDSFLLKKNFSIPDLFDKNQKLTLKNLKNDKNRYTIINLFASWCTTCLEEHRNLMKIKNKKDVDFYGIAWNDYSDNVKKFLQTHGNPYDRVFLDGKNEFGRLIALKAIPETLVINQDGLIILRIQGAIDEENLLQILNYL
jgi:cytochrome c biogenesis protein CcmG/thiol:disulfide interchange protein DsbE